MAFSVTPNADLLLVVMAMAPIDLLDVGHVRMTDTAGAETDVGARGGGESGRKGGERCCGNQGLHHGGQLLLDGRECPRLTIQTGRYTGSVEALVP